MFTLKDYLLAEMDGQDPTAAMAQDRMVTLTAEIRNIMSSITLANLSDVAKDSNLISFLDIIEALNTTEEVIRDRLSSEGADVDVLGTNDTERVAAQGKEWQGDEERNYETLFNSIEAQVKDTIRTIYTGSKGGEGIGNLPQFIAAFNRLIVERVIDALKALGPAEASKAVGGIIESAKQAVLNVEKRSGQENSASLQQIVQKYRVKRPATIGKKHASSRNKHDRINLNTAMVS